MVLCLLVPAAASAQNTYRLLGRVVTDKGEPIADAEVRVEAFYGKAAGAVSGQRTYTATTDKKGAWNVMGIRPGVWLFEAVAPGYYPESVALPIQIVASSSSGQTGMALTWQLVLKPIAMPDETRAKLLMTGAIPDGASADDVAGAGRLALQARDSGMARALFQKALERDPSSYRAALGIATTFMLARDFDSASRVFDAARNRTHDKDEIKFITVALSDLATIMTK
ncbi:MAG TPA: carboxypeptidase regulatory-like domain-containing protein [Vicinamibacterales bacterium]|nr:carboxypeptidase regulatory-like domain-containing protein [Vicinamibacterales bacterium]